MSAPANDNFTSATPLSAASGTIAGTTVLATTESGEPGHPRYNPCPAYPQGNGTLGPFNSVWYAWTCPTSGAYFFTTRGVDGGGQPLTNFKSTLQVFQVVSGSPAVNNLTRIQDYTITSGGIPFWALTEVFPGDPWTSTPIVTTNPTLYDQSVGCSGGLDNGASFAFVAAAGTTYYIQIDTRAANVTGTFAMTWGTWVRLSIGQCGTDVNNNANVVCYGTVQIADLTTNNFYSFGAIPAAPGNYYVLLDKGNGQLVNDYGGSTPDAGVIDGDITACADWPSGGGVWSCDPTYDIPTVICTGTCIPHHDTHRPIGIACLGNSLATNSSLNPTYMLTYYPFTIDMLNNGRGWNELECGNIATGATTTSWKAKFYITLNGLAEFDQTIVTLLSSGGISSPSAPQSVDLAANATTATGEFTFTADCTAGLLTATLQISRNGIVVGTLVYPLYPIFVVTFTPNDLEKTCTLAGDGGTFAGKYWRSTFNVTCIWPPGGIGAGDDQFDFGYAAVTCSNPSEGTTGTCQVIENATVISGPNLYDPDAGYPNACSPVTQVNEYGCGAYIAGLYPVHIGLQAGASPQAATVQIVIQWQTSPTAIFTLNTATFDLTIPAA